MFLSIPLFFSSPLFQLQKAETTEADEADEADEEPAVVQSAQVFAPKSLVLVSRLDHTEVFKVRYSSIIRPGCGLLKHILVFIQENTFHVSAIIDRRPAHFPITVSNLTILFV